MKTSSAILSARTVAGLFAALFAAAAVFSSSNAQGAAPPRPDVPAAIAAPASATVSSKLHATGAQIYVCADSAGSAGAPHVYGWTLKAPDAALTDGTGAPAGHHGAGPVWTSKDGSAVNARKLAQADAPSVDAVPWLLLRATTTSGNGVFSKVTYVQRVGTSNGKPPASGCDAKHAGLEKRVDYTADYYFYEGAESEPALLPVGSPAPDFTAVTYDGKKAALAALTGKYVVLYFYPKDDTPGCTKEACDFRDSWGELQKSGVAVFGVSTQGNDSHKAFTEKYHLPFPLVPDENGALAAKYGVPVVGGKARRLTYLIGKDGKIAHVWPEVTPVGHAAQVMAAIAAH
jgi:peroxiredoxin Q/BCP